MALKRTPKLCDQKSAFLNQYRYVRYLCIANTFYIYIIHSNTWSWSPWSCGEEFSKCSKLWHQSRFQRICEVIETIWNPGDNWWFVSLSAPPSWESSRWSSPSRPAIPKSKMHKITLKMGFNIFKHYQMLETTGPCYFSHQILAQLILSHTQLKFPRTCDP